MRPVLMSFTGWLRHGCFVACMIALATTAFSAPATVAELLVPVAPPSTGPAPLTESAQRIKLAEGFTATLFAGEPDIVQPIAFTFDDRGRLWVVETMTYPHWLTEKQEGHDRITILEDTDGDGRFDKRTVFADNLKNVSAIALGFGGVWLGAIPNLEFIPVNPGEDKPAGPPQILLDGWNVKDVQHNIFSSFTWGPDGWLWATNGIQSKSKVGKPGTPDDRRVKFDCGIWRYHPTKHIFEIVACGMVNPWGLDFDEYGECFITNCVLAHLWHVIPGGYYQRMYGQHYNPYTYGLLQTCADHLHWAAGTNWTDSRGNKPEQSEAGGGHATIGAMIYLADNWPDSYRGSIFMCNLHGNRVNNDILAPKGSGYVAHHGKDFAFWNDPWFRGLSIQYGPDGGVFVTDWSDTGECHNHNVADMTNGRIYKITYGKPKPVAPDLAKMTDEQLVGLLSSKNEWWERHARRILQERATAKPMAETAAMIASLLQKSDDPKLKLKAVWALNQVGGMTPAITTELLANPEPYVRSWAIRLSVDQSVPDAALLAKFAEMAHGDPSPVVRLHLASAIQRLPLVDRWPIAQALVQHGDDVADANLPLMDWFGIEPLVSADTPRSLELAAASKLAIVQQYIGRRAADGSNAKGIAAVTAFIGKSNDDDLQKNLINGIKEALAGLRQVPMPQGWSETYQHVMQSKRGDVRDVATELALVFGDTEAFSSLRAQAADPKVDPAARGRAINLLVTAKDGELTKMLEGLLGDKDVRGAAIRGLAATGSPTSPKLILADYKDFSASEKADAVQTLVSRPSYAAALLDAVQSGVVARSDLTAYTIRQIAGINDGVVKAKLKEVWGTVRPPEKDKAARIAQLKKQLTPEVLKAADLKNGRLIFTKTCSACHTLFDTGGKVGPNLTGSQRALTDYVLENVIDPSAQVANEYRANIVDAEDGRTIIGIIVGETEQTLTLRTPNEDVVLPKKEIIKRRISPASMMPEGLLDALKPDEQRDLVGYLESPVQVPLP